MHIGRKKKSYWTNTLLDLEEDLGKFAELQS